MDTHPARASSRSMAELGHMVDDLHDLNGKYGGERIAACKNWHHLHLAGGIKLITDSWHKRYYWENEGGSHHMAVLCHELTTQSKEWNPSVTVTEYTLNPALLSETKESLAFFVMPHQPNKYGISQAFKPMQRLEDRPYLKGSIGVEVFSHNRRYPAIERVRPLSVVVVH